MSLLSVVAIGAAGGFLILWARFGFAEVRNWLRVLWVCRVSVASVLAGIVLMDVAQAQDVFAETSRSLLLGISYWLGFLFLLFWGWAFPVHFAARRILDLEDWVIHPRRGGLARARRRVVLQARYRRAITWVPRILGFLCFAAVAWGIWAAWTNLAAAAQNLPQAGRANAQMPWLLAGVAMALGLFAWFVIERHALSMALGRRLAASAASPTHAGEGLITRDLVWFGDFFAWLGLPRALGATPGPVRWSARVFEQGLAFAFVTVLTVGFGIVLLAPFTISDLLPRAMFLVTMLGASVFLFTFLAALGHRWRLPLIAGMVAILAIMTAYVPLHEVRQIADARPDLPRAKRQVALKDAVDRWKAANGCGSGGSCHPIIVAGQGGASRAGFYIATVLGELLDRTRKDPATYDDFGTRLFALSTVSGSSVGAVVLRAALEDGGARARSAGSRASPSPPCGAERDPLWFGTPRMRVDRPWQSCLETILAGDFLSPTFVGLAYRDNLVIPALADRAALLEMAWERRYADLLDQHRERGETGLRRRFGYWLARLDETGQSWLPLLLLNGTAVATGRRIVASDVLPWIPSVNADGSPGRRPIFSEAFDLFEILASCAPGAKLSAGGLCPSGPPDETSVFRAADITLSTAATISARFPIISPSGALRNAEGRLVEDVVDGGYFENDGLITARELAQGMRLIDPALEPIVLHIANDPDQELRNATQLARPAGARTPSLPMAPIGRLLAGYTSAPIGLFATRQGHGGEAAQAVVEFIGNKPHWLQVKAYSTLEMADPKQGQKEAMRAARQRAITMEKLSMSWWLSQPVQEYLNAQVSAPRNQQVLQQLEVLLRKQ